MKRFFLVLALLCASLTWADESYIGIYLRGVKVGYIETTSAQVKLNGKTATKTDSNTIIRAALLGQEMNLDIKSSTWTDPKGAPLRMKTTTSSAGRGQVILADFSGQKISLTIDSSGTVTKKNLQVPNDGKIVDDAVMAMLTDRSAPGAKKTYYALDPMTATLVKNTVTLIGKSKAIVRGLPFDATLIEVSEPRAVTRVFIGSKGDFIKAEAPLGMELLPLTKAEALKPNTGTSLQDLAVLSRIQVDKPFDETGPFASVKLRFTGADMKALPSDTHQTVTKSGGSWIVEIHPIAPDSQASGEIAEAAAAHPEWIAPSLNIPSKSPTFTALAKKIVGDTSNVVEAAAKIRAYVTHEMTPNASIGVLRDASEVLKTKEGVCRDYAVLTTSLLRAAGIPSRLSSGLLYTGGAFYYHAWAQAFDGKEWFGVDSTRPDGLVGVGHIELAYGSVEEAFSFTFLDQVKVEVLETVRKH